MKPSPFTYLAPGSTSEALAFLSQHGFDAKLLAGGQSLIPAMNFRLAQPAALIDLNTIPDLAYLRPQADGGLAVGAMTRHSTIEHSTARRSSSASLTNRLISRFFTLRRMRSPLRTWASGTPMM